MIGKSFLKILKNVMIMNLITVKITHQWIDKWEKKNRRKIYLKKITSSAINNS